MPQLKQLMSISIERRTHVLSKKFIIDSTHVKTIKNEYSIRSNLSEVFAHFTFIKKNVLVKETEK